MQKLVYDWTSMGIWQMIAVLIPFKSKKYVKKWIDIRKDWINYVHIDAMSNIRFNIIWRPDVDFDCPWSGRICSGISIRDMWDNALEMIAQTENMRNVEELKIWLDMRA